MSIFMVLLQNVASNKLPNSAPDSSLSFWLISQVVVTLIIFIGVYFIFKPVFENKQDNDEMDKKDS